MATHSPTPSRIVTLASARARPLRCGPKDSIIEALAPNEMLNAVELVQWENGKSINDIAASQGIRIRRHCRPTAPLKDIEEELGAPATFWRKSFRTRRLMAATALVQGLAKKSLKVVIGAAKHAPPARDFFGALAAAYKRNGVPALIAEVKKASPNPVSFTPSTPQHVVDTLYLGLSP